MLQVGLIGAGHWGPNLVQSIELLASVTKNFVEQCIDGINATAKGPAMVEQGLAICTGLVPAIGYDAAAKIAQEAQRTGKTVREVARETTDLTEEQLDELLDAEAMTEPTAKIAAGG